MLVSFTDSNSYQPISSITTTLKFIQTLVRSCDFIQTSLNSILLGNFLHNNYQQALEILQQGEMNLSKIMQDLDIADVSLFDHWIADEKEYWQKLVNLSASQ
jgi:hypothetical protein